MRDEALWRRLQTYRFAADDTPTPFVRHLMREEGWTEKFALSVIEEYRRFLYLTQVVPGEATPSWRVDRAWHLHLTHTRDYWERLCPEALGRPLHHEPGGTPADARRHEEQYLATRALYVEEFGTTPPARIWRPAWHGTAAKIAGWVTLIGFLVMVGAQAPGVNSTQASVAGLGAFLIGCLVWSIFRDPAKRKEADLRSSYGGGGGGCGGGGE